MGASVSVGRGVAGMDEHKTHDEISTNAAMTQLLGRLPSETDESANVFASGSGENPQIHEASEEALTQSSEFAPVNFTIVKDAVPRATSAWSNEPESEEVAPIVEKAARSSVFLLAGALVVIATGLALLLP